MITHDDYTAIAEHAMSRMTPYERDNAAKAIDMGNADLCTFFLAKYAEECGRPLRTQKQKHAAVGAFVQAWSNSIHSSG